MLADFTVEIQSFEPIDRKSTILPKEAMDWSLNIDGLTTKFGVGIGVVLESATGVIIEDAMRMKRKITNNEVEYKALIFGLELAQTLGIQILKVYLDSNWF